MLKVWFWFSSEIQLDSKSPRWPWGSPFLCLVGPFYRCSLEPTSGSSRPSETYFKCYQSDRGRAQLSGGPGLEWFLPGKDLQAWCERPKLGLASVLQNEDQIRYMEGKSTNTAECLHAPETMLAFYVVVCFIPYSGPPSEVDLFSTPTFTFHKWWNCASEEWNRLPPTNKWQGWYLSPDLPNLRACYFPLFSAIEISGMVPGHSKTEFTDAFKE